MVDSSNRETMENFIDNLKRAIQDIPRGNVAATEQAIEEALQRNAEIVLDIKERLSGGSITEETLEELLHEARNIMDVPQELINMIIAKIRGFEAGKVEGEVVRTIMTVGPDGKIEMDPELEFNELVGEIAAIAKELESNRALVITDTESNEEITFEQLITDSKYNNNDVAVEITYDPKKDPNGKFDQLTNLTQRAQEVSTGLPESTMNAARAKISALNAFLDIGRQKEKQSAISSAINNTLSAALAIQAAHTPSTSVESPQQEALQLGQGESTMQL